MKSYKIVYPVLVVLILVFVFSSCKKKEGCTDATATNYDSSAEKDNGTCTYCVAGAGGDVTIVARLQHHGVTIPNIVGHLDSVYVKYNATNSPGTDLSLFDTLFIGEAGEDHVHLEGLKCGKYYLFGAGYDPAQDSIHHRVTGGIPYNLTTTTGEVDINVPVSE
jgi:hypothetical protein